jgi:Tol biopolymer transport system component
MDIPKSSRAAGIGRYTLTSTLVIAVAVVLVYVALTNGRPVDRSSQGDPKPAQSAQTPVQSLTSPAISKICFLRHVWTNSKDRYWIFLKDLNSGKEVKLIEGTSPSLSPTGETVVFMVGKSDEDPLADSVPVGGRIDHWRMKVRDLRRNEDLEFSTLANIRAFKPLWSSDGARIAFEFIDANTNKGGIGVLNLSTGTWQNIAKNMDLSSPSGSPIYLDSWISDGQSVLFHTSENIYEAGLDGRLLQKISTAPFEIATGDTRFLLSLDKKQLVFNRTDDSSEGPTETIYRFDRTSNKLSRVTPKTIYGRAPAWLPSEKEILFTCTTPATDRSSSDLCKIGIDGTGLTTLVRNAAFGSYSTR